MTQRQHEREAEDAQIRRRLNQQRLLLRDQRDQPARQRHRQRDAERAADERQQHALGQQLPDQLAAGRAQRQPHRDFPLAHEPAGNQQVRDIGAGDQQDEADHPHQDDQRRREIIAQRRVADVGFLHLQLALHELFADVGVEILRAGQRHFVLRGSA